MAIVGKGVTFDSGGYNLKAGAGSMIELMKFDMGGAAATLGAAKAVSLLKPQGVAVHFLVPACENMVDGKGLRPGDVLTAANGKTVEVRCGVCVGVGHHVHQWSAQVVNTDAEGRLTIADALWYAEHKLNATAIVNIATLTGAMIVSLGTGIAGLFSPNDDIAERCGSLSCCQWHPRVRTTGCWEPPRALVRSCGACHWRRAMLSSSRARLPT